MRFFCLSPLMFAVVSLSQAAPLSQREICAQSSPAVVQVDGGGEMNGSGFIVSPDGYILTANHVIRDHEGKYYSTILITMIDGSSEFATPAAPISVEVIGKDYALLKIETKKPLPFLTLGSNDDVVIGGDAAIIGFPFSAIFPQKTQITREFCLTGTFAAQSSEQVIVPTRSLKNPALPIVQHNVQVDIIYFQGPSVKGVSGSPILSRDTGKVVGIVSQKMSGLGDSLESLMDETAKGLGGVPINGLDPGKAVNQILTVLDRQLANGLGAATGIEDPKEALRQAQREKK